MSVNHYENFPVASWLCPAALRPAIQAIYWFARTADDLADEGTASPAQRHAALREYRADLHRAAAGLPASDRWAGVFVPLAQAIARHRLPPKLLDALLTAFIRDIDNPLYPSRTELLDYCHHSADPVGRLLLHLYGVHDEAALRQSDAICTALQLINFWQDLSVDLPRGRHYVPEADLQRWGLVRTHLTLGMVVPAGHMGEAPPPGFSHSGLPHSVSTTAGPSTLSASHPPHTVLSPHQRQHLAAMLGELITWTRTLMMEGVPLVHRLPGRVGWELRLVVQGGLRVLEKIEAMNPQQLHQRPVLHKLDAPRLLWRALWMPKH